MEQEASERLGEKLLHWVKAGFCVEAGFCVVAEESCVSASQL